MPLTLILSLRPPTPREALENPAALLAAATWLVLAINLLVLGCNAIVDGTRGWCQQGASRASVALLLTCTLLLCQHLSVPHPSPFASHFLGLPLQMGMTLYLGCPPTGGAAPAQEEKTTVPVRGVLASCKPPLLTLTALSVVVVVIRGWSLDLQPTGTLYVSLLSLVVLLQAGCDGWLVYRVVESRRSLLLAPLLCFAAHLTMAYQVLLMVLDLRLLQYAWSLRQTDFLSYGEAMACVQSMYLLAANTLEFFLMGVLPLALSVPRAVRIMRGFPHQKRNREPTEGFPVERGLFFV